MDEMKRFLSTREDSQSALAQFARVENVVGNRKGKYVVRDWFLENYPRHAEMIVENAPKLPTA